MVKNGNNADNSLDILLYLFDNPGSTTSDIAKAVWDIPDVSTLRSKDNSVRYCLEKKYASVVKSEKVNGKKRYEIDNDRFAFGVGRINIVSTDGEEISVGLGSIILMIDGEDRPVVVTVHKSA